MKNYIRFFAAVLAVAFAYVAPLQAQVVTQLPQFVAPRAVLDTGNGPLEFRFLTGNGGIFTSQGSAVSTTVTASTSVTLNAPATTLPCIGCVISGTGIPVASSVTVTAVTGTTNLTLSSQVTVATGTTLSYGAACPSAPPTAPMALVQAAVGADMPFYTQARVCLYGATGPGMQFLSFPIGAH